MAESIEELSQRLEESVAPGFRGRMLDRGIARGLIWRNGQLPKGSPPFSSELTEDLLDYAYAVMSMALRLRTLDAKAPILVRVFLVAGGAIESAIHRGGGGFDHGFHRATAAVAFHLARYSARAYSVLPMGVDADNLAPGETTLINLLRRNLDGMHESFSSWLLDERHEDGYVASLLQNNEEVDENDALHSVVTSSFMRGLALFDHAITTGEPESAEKAKRRMLDIERIASELHMVNHRWTALLSSHLIDELWNLSLYQQIPALLMDDAPFERWRDLRRSYIQRLRAGKRSAIELWPSQLEAARRAIDPSDDLVVALPTSAGKTRIAEFCILRALAAEQRVIYVTPLRALSAQVERDLAETFQPLGFAVSSLYGSAGVESEDSETLRKGKIVVATPEKLDFALRNDTSIINDVGLIVLDEGHMFGPNEREVRYEALVQRLLVREDASVRRIVCLSALFPPPGEMRDFVAWIRQDEPGDPVHSTWKPTRQRFGVLRWMTSAARLEIEVEDENPFVPRFVEVRESPEGSRRRKSFPSNKKELTLATAWRFIEQEKNVLIYCPIKKSVETLGKLILKCLEHGVLDPLRKSNPCVQDAMATGTEWLGTDHPAVRCLQYGVALHHGGLPRPFLKEIEGLLRSGDCPLTIASPTVAQGLNLSASVLLVPSIWRNQEIIPAAEFANVAGRAGRAFVDVEGLVLHIVWEDTTARAIRVLRDWEQLVAKAKASRVVSGILLLATNIYERIGKAAGVSVDEVVEYLMGNTEAWNFEEYAEDKVGVTNTEWERDIASLDSAILALLDADTAEDGLEFALNSVLEGSLFSRQLAQEEERLQVILRGFIAARAHRIWSDTESVQRKGYHTAGIGLSAGQFLDENLKTLIGFLVNAEGAIFLGDSAAAAQSVVGFAELIFQTAPFRASREMPENWKDALRAWIEGRPTGEVVQIIGNGGIELLQGPFTYRLPWAMEAVRVHALAVGQDDSDALQGLAALAVETGSANRSVTTLLRSGLSSREAAITAVESTSASFDDRGGMRWWLESKEVKERATENDWPTAGSRHAWIQFYNQVTKADHRVWKRETQKVGVEWLEDIPPIGSHVVVETNGSNLNCIILTPDFVRIGSLKKALKRPRRDIVGAVVDEGQKTISVEYFGPPSKQ